MISLLSELPSLQSFYFSGPYRSLTLSQFPELETVKVEGRSSKLLSVKLSGLPSLSILELRSVSYEDSPDFSGTRMTVALVIGFSNLREVQLSLCRFKSYDSLIVKGCDSSECCNIDLYQLTNFYMFVETSFIGIMSGFDEIVFESKRVYSL